MGMLRMFEKDKKGTPVFMSLFLIGLLCFAAGLVTCAMIAIPSVAEKGSAKINCTEMAAKENARIAYYESINSSPSPPAYTAYALTIIGMGSLIGLLGSAVLFGSDLVSRIKDGAIYDEDKGKLVSSVVKKE